MRNELGRFVFKNDNVNESFKNELWLTNEYVNNFKTIQELAIFCNVTETTIKRYLRKFNIKVRPNYFHHLSNDKQYQNKDWLDNAYNKELLSLSQIAKQFNVGHVTISNWMKKYNISRRNNSDCRKGNLNPCFIGFYISRGYKYLYSPELAKIHNRKGTKGNYIQEHVKVMYEHLGRPITKLEVIHHKDGNRLNNDISNLTLMSSNSEHTKYEQSLNTFAKQILYGNLIEDNSIKESLLKLFNQFIKEQ